MCVNMNIAEDKDSWENGETGSGVLWGQGLTKAFPILVTDTQASKIEGFVFMIDWSNWLSTDILSVETLNCQLYQFDCGKTWKHWLLSS